MAMRSATATVEEAENDLRYVVCEVLVLAPPDIVWPILTDYQKVPMVFANVKKLKVLTDSGCLKIMEHQVQPLPPVPSISFTVEVKETYPTLLQWRGLTNYIKENQGFFSLQPTACGRHTSVKFAVWAEAAAIVPAAIIRYQLRKIMPSVLFDVESARRKHRLT